MSLSLKLDKPTKKMEEIKKREKVEREKREREMKSEGEKKEVKGVYIRMKQRKVPIVQKNRQRLLNVI